VKPRTRRQALPVKINRKVPKPALKPFTEYFQGFEKVGAVRKVFGDRTEEVLSGLRIGFMPNRQMYMGIRDNDGNLAIGTYHLKTSPTRTLYLDIVHELFHVNQRMANEKYFHDEFMKFMQDRSLYYASPIEIPAYEHTVREAERIGMPRDEIVEYLKMGPAPAKTWRSFLKEMKFSKGPAAKRVTRFPVRIKRETTPSLHRFTDYFEGFERVPAVRELFGEKTEAVLGGIKVEFIDSPWPTIFPYEDDGRLVASTEYIREGGQDSVYLDAFLCLNLLKSFSDAGAATASPDSLWENPGVLHAYSAMVKEARRLGLPESEILTHLTLPGFLMSKSGYRRFLKSLGLRPNQATTTA
jgi:DNA-dependent RNA polymerase auxiliary subunit epsilon